MEFRSSPGAAKGAGLYFEGVSRSGLSPGRLRSWLGSSTVFVLATGPPLRPGWGEELPLSEMTAKFIFEYVSIKREAFESDGQGVPVVAQW